MMREGFDLGRATVSFLLLFPKASRFHSWVTLQRKLIYSFCLVSTFCCDIPMIPGIPTMPKASSSSAHTTDTATGWDSSWGMVCRHDSVT